MRCAGRAFFVVPRPGHPKQGWTAVTKPRAKKKPQQKPWLRQASLHSSTQQQPERIRAPGPPRLLSRVEVQAITGRSYPTLWSWMRQGKFPRSRDTGGKSAWLESDIAAWMDALPLRRLKGDA
jgi:predicted DNA-binding transcriptional regulator AlpA